MAEVGEFVGYALRIVFGYLSDRTGRYWPIALWRYGLTFVAVSLLALDGSWQVAAALIIAERLGRAVRTLARDTILNSWLAGHRDGDPVDGIDTVERLQGSERPQKRSRFRQRNV